MTAILPILLLLWGLACILTAVFCDNVRHKIFFLILGGPFGWFSGIILLIVFGAEKLAERLNKS